MPSKIEWLARPDTIPESWNVVSGCSPVSEGCAHCWARRMSQRLAGRFGYPKDDPFAVTLHPDKLDVPLHWRKPRTVFVCSMSDLFHEDVLDRYICDVLYTIWQVPQHTFLVLTKRPQRMYEWFTRPAARDSHWHRPMPNLWLGVTAENQQRADERIPLLLRCPAAVRFVSVEPMLGPVDLCVGDPHLREPHWIIVGGESGPGARPMHPDWARSVRDQCAAAGVPFFFKQWGAWAPATHYLVANYKTMWLDESTGMCRAGKRAAGHLLDGKEYREWPSV